MRIKASPTKEFFITMLTRDISLDRAILDLIDNSVDAAHVSGKLDDKEIKISISSSRFVIEDNCGGISVDTAEKYAFRFGRDNKDNRDTPNSVGQFGVGMKRTLFKLGKLFKVESSFFHSNVEQSFYIDIDVDEWLAESSDEWGFNLSNAPVSVSNGTKITVERLLKSVSEQFSLNEFIQSIATEIAQAHFKALNQGLKVTINDVPINSFEILINTSDQLKPIVHIKEFEGVKISITAGISSQDYHLGGWYIICNGRLIEFAEKTKKTLWDVGVMPKYHDRFAYFRGVVEFECADSSKLPWTTTKTGIDVDNAAYRVASKYMMEAFKQISIFLNQVVSEKELLSKGNGDIIPLLDSIKNSAPIEYSKLEKNDNFVRPDFIRKTTAITHANITYKVEIEKANAAMIALDASSFSDLGRKTFDYFYNDECD
jgi:hypothetical protein